ncbi:serine/threonine-protein phosphatase [bacterium]|nr:serine/threonine-protein phosphatase [bacterium]
MLQISPVLQETITQFSQASNEYELCELLADVLHAFQLTKGFALYLQDSSHDSQLVLTSNSWNPTDDIHTLPIMHAAVKHGYIEFEQYSSEHTEHIKFLLQIAGISFSAIMNTHNAIAQKKQLGKSTLVLDTMLEMLSDIILQKDKKSIAQIAGQFLMGYMRVSSYAIIGFSYDGSLQVLSHNGYNEETLNSALRHLQNDPKTLMNENILVPMEHGPHLQGYILLKDRKSHPYSDDDVSFVSMVGMITALSIERTVLFEEESRLNAIEKDLALAKEIQQYLLPSFTEHVDGLEVTGLHVPSREIGGDYIDILHYSDKSLLLIIADVAGKGISAALIMSMVKSACSLLVQQGRRPLDIMHSINQLVHEHTASNTFVTCACIYINPQRTMITSINAGHELPLLKKRNGEIIELNQGCIALGVLNKIDSIKQSEHNIELGDIICMYTDGLCDSTTVEGNLPMHNLLSECNNNSLQSASKSIAHHMNANRNVQGISMEDDASLLLIRIVS